MSIVIGPTYALDGSFGQQVAAHAFGAIGSVLDMPVAMMSFMPPILGDPVVFEEGAAPHLLPVPIPRLEGLDEIEVAGASFALASAPFVRSESVSAGSPSSGAVGLTLSGVASGQAALLTDLSVTGLAVTPPPGISFALAGTNRTLYWTTDIESGETVSQTSSPGGVIQHLHLLVRPGTGGGAGPPLAAAPHFAMPGAGGGLYGPALGGAALSVERRSNGLVDLALTLAPAQPMQGCTLLIGTASQPSANGGLPNEVGPVTWSATSVEASFDVRPKGITVTTHAGATDPADGVLVARFDTDPGAGLLSVDFAPAARSVLTDGYPTSQGSDLGLALRFAVDTPSALYLQLGTVAARYVQRPEPTPASVTVRGAPESVHMPVPPGLRPMGVSFRVDGRYGPARLTADADTAPAASRQGYRLAGPVQVARRLILNSVEQTLPLARFGLFGRASEPGELLITRHRGDEIRIGPAIGAPVSLPVEPADVAQWHRAPIGVTDGLPPQSEALWIVVRATKGVFWWHADLEAATASAQRSADDGATWTSDPGRPFLQSWVLEVDKETGAPAPLQPLQLGWDGGVLNGDLVGTGQGPQAPEFTRLWVAEGAAHAALLDSIATLEGGLSLVFSCRRDVDLSVRDLVLTYDPWTARGGP